jgi:hypothetical protein
VARVTLVPLIVPAQNSANLVAQNLSTVAVGGSSAAPGVGAGNGIQFTNFPGQTVLLVSTTGTATTPTIAIGTTLYGQTSPGIAMTALAATALSLLGPFYSIEELQLAGTSGLCAVDFSSATGVTCVALQLSGVY